MSEESRSLGRYQEKQIQYQEDKISRLYYQYRRYRSRPGKDYSYPELAIPNYCKRNTILSRILQFLQVFYQRIQKNCKALEQADSKKDLFCIRSGLPGSF
jgi:hypothetical protein